MLKWMRTTATVPTLKGTKLTIYLKKASIDKEKLLSLLKSQIMAGNIQGAVKVCSGNPTPVTRIIQQGLTKFNRPDSEVQAAMDEAFAAARTAIDVMLEARDEKDSNEFN